MNSIALQMLLSKAKQSKILDLPDADLSVDNIEEIARTIPNIDGLVAINLSGMENSLSLETAKSLFNAIKQCKNILYLDLSLCKLNNQHVKLLVEAIQDHPSLVDLAISNNDISHDGVLAIIQIFKNSKLLSLDLSENKIGISTGEKIAEAIEDNNTLLSLNLFSCGLRALSIDKEDKRKISRKLEANLELFKAVLSSQDTFYAIPKIPIALVEYLSKSFSDQMEHAFSTVFIYEKRQKSGNLSSDDAEVKENFSPNPTRR